MSRSIVTYCAECEWSVDSDDHNRSDLSEAAIEHAVATGHDIDSGLAFLDPRTNGIDEQISNDDGPKRAQQRLVSGFLK